MDKSVLKRVLLGNQYEIEKINLIKRDYDIDEYERLVLVGIRRAGKSFLLYQKIKDILTEEETQVYKRGRNFHTGNTPKNSTAGEYHTATGLETLFGFLHLSNNNERAKEIFDIIWNNTLGTL